MFRKIVLVALSVALLVWLAGCSSSPTQPGNNKSIESQFGGFTTSPEAPGFGDPTVAASVANEKPVNDPIANLGLIDSLLADSNSGVFHLRVMWGRIPCDSTVTSITNWNGSLSISRGALIVRRKVRFEHRNDTILPRTDRKTVSWISQTGPCNDGIAVDLIVPPTMWLLDSGVTGPVTVRFETGPYSRTFLLSELVALDTIVNLDDSNAVAFHAFRYERLFCPRGFLNGHWGYDSTGAGVFDGMWISRGGLIDGYLRGTFGTNDSGKKIFFGKWIDKDGRFEGLLRGFWGQKPNEHADSMAFLRAGGWFRGGIYNANVQLIGIVKGKFQSSERRPNGFMQGRWRVGCFGRDDDGMEGKDDDRFEDHSEDFEHGMREDSGHGRGGH